MSEWQPIETAPREEQRVLLYRHGFSESMAVCWYYRHAQLWIPVDGGLFPEPTHWMPLPDPPRPDEWLRRVHLQPSSSATIVEK